MQDHDRALIVGQTSFGKGLVQSIIPLEYGAGLTLTSAKYFTPSGRLFSVIIRMVRCMTTTRTAVRRLEIKRNLLSPLDPKEKLTLVEPFVVAEESRLMKTLMQKP